MRGLFVVLILMMGTVSFAKGSAESGAVEAQFSKSGDGSDGGEVIIWIPY